VEASCPDPAAAPPADPYAAPCEDPAAVLPAAYVPAPPAASESEGVAEAPPPFLIDPGDGGGADGWGGTAAGSKPPESHQAPGPFESDFGGELPDFALDGFEVPDFSPADEENGESPPDFAGPGGGEGGEDPDGG
jgi:hypothetical protein